MAFVASSLDLSCSLTLRSPLQTKNEKFFFDHQFHFTCKLLPRTYASCTTANSGHTVSLLVYPGLLQHWQRLLHSLFQTLRNRSRVRLTPSRWSDRPARRLDLRKTCRYYWVMGKRSPNQAVHVKRSFDMPERSRDKINYYLG